MFQAYTNLSLLKIDNPHCNVQTVNAQQLYFYSVGIEWHADRQFLVDWGQPGISVFNISCMAKKKLLSLSPTSLADTASHPLQSFTYESKLYLGIPGNIVWSHHHGGHKHCSLSVSSRVLENTSYTVLFPFLPEFSPNIFICERMLTSLHFIKCYTWCARLSARLSQ